MYSASLKKELKRNLYPKTSVRKKEKIITSQYLLKYNPRKCFSTNYYNKLLLLLGITTNI